jgi:hypothetical protein
MHKLGLLRIRFTLPGKQEHPFANFSQPIFIQIEINQNVINLS